MGQERQPPSGWPWESGGDKCGVSMKKSRPQEEKLSLTFSKKLPRKAFRGVMSPQVGLPEIWSPPLFPLPVTESPHPRTLGNFPIPHQEKNKEETTNAGRNGSMVDRDLVLCQLRGGGGWGLTGNGQGDPATAWKQGQEGSSIS